MTRKAKTISLAAVVGLAAVVLIVMNLMPRRPSAPDGASKAAAKIVAEQGGGEQPRDAQGVPADAVRDPNVPVGPSKFGK
jgi:hypothetical protein